MADDMRAALEAAYEKHSDEEPTEGGTPGDSGSGGTSGGSQTDASQSVGATSTEATPYGEEPNADAKPADAKTGDAGKTAPGVKPGKPIGAQGEETQQQRAAGKDLGAGKAPVSWKPAVRQHWDKLPQEVRAEIGRRETEIQRGLATASEARHFREEFQEVVRPFEGIIRSQNSTPIAAVRNLMTTAAGLTLGSGVQKANIIAEIIQNYGVDISVLDQVLAGQAPAENKGGGNANEIMPMVQRMIAEGLAPVNQMVSAQQQRGMQVANGAVEDFAETHEFMDDLSEEMADIMENASNRNRAMTMERAYDIAARAHPEIGPLYERSKAAAATTNGNGRANRAQLAASSVRASGPAGGGSVSPTDLRGAITAAFDKHSRV